MFEIEPNEYLPDAVKRVFSEASSIVDLSPRGAAALARLCVQELLSSLGEQSNINEAIANLVKNGLDPRLQQALDIGWVIGNNAVHPGEINIQDDAATAKTLLKLINQISEAMITHKREIGDLFESLPEGAKSAIRRRDS